MTSTAAEQLADLLRLSSRATKALFAWQRDRLRYVSAQLRLSHAVGVAVQQFAEHLEAVALTAGVAPPPRPSLQGHVVDVEDGASGDAALGKVKGAPSDSPRGGDDFEGDRAVENNKGGDSARTPSSQPTAEAAQTTSAADDVREAMRSADAAVVGNSTEATRRPEDTPLTGAEAHHDRTATHAPQWPRTEIEDSNADGGKGGGSREQVASNEGSSSAPPAIAAAVPLRSSEAGGVPAPRMAEPGAGGLPGVAPAQLAEARAEAECRRLLEELVQYTASARPRTLRSSIETFVLEKSLEDLHNEAAALATQAVRKEALLHQLLAERRQLLTAYSTGMRPPASGDIYPDGAQAAAAPASAFDTAGAEGSMRCAKCVGVPAMIAAGCSCRGKWQDLVGAGTGLGVTIGYPPRPRSDGNRLQPAAALTGASAGGARGAAEETAAAGVSGAAEMSDGDRKSFVMYLEHLKAHRRVREYKLTMLRPLLAAEDARYAALTSLWARACAVLVARVRPPPQPPNATPDGASSTDTATSTTRNTERSHGVGAEGGDSASITDDQAVHDDAGAGTRSRAATGIAATTSAEGVASRPGDIDDNGSNVLGAGGTAVGDLRRKSEDSITSPVAVSAETSSPPPIVFQTMTPPDAASHSTAATASSPSAAAAAAMDVPPLNNRCWCVRWCACESSARISSVCSVTPRLSCLSNCSFSTSAAVTGEPC